MSFRHDRWALVASAAAAVTIATAAASPEAPLPKDLPAYGEDKPMPAPQIEKKTLRNGLAVWVVSREGLPRVDYVLAIQNAGLARDDRQHPGFAGYLASLLSEGSAKRESKAIAESAQSYGGSVSASAISDGIMLTADALASNAEPMLELLAEIVRQPSFPAAEIKLAKANALQQLKADETQPAFRAEREIGSVLYGDHPYARTQPTEATIAALTPELLKAQHAERFRPDRALLVIAGRIAPAKAFAFAENAFGDWKTPDGTAASIASAPQELAPKRVLLQRPGSVQATMRIAQPAVSATHPDHVPLQVATTIVGGSSGSRLMRNLREDKGYTYHTGAGYRFNREGGGIVGRADVRNDVAGAALQEFMAEYRRLGREPVPAGELDVNKRYIAGSYLLRNQLQGAFASALASNWLVGLPPEYLSEFVQKVRQVSTAEVMAMGRKYFDPARQSIVVVADEAVAGQLEAHGKWTVAKPPASGSKTALQYPASARVDHIDEYHGERLADPYRWLERLDAGETRAWVEAQNQLARTHLESSPMHAWFKNRLTELWNYERYGVPAEENGRYFWVRNDGLQNHSVLYVAESLEGAPRVLIDPNTLSADGTVSMSGFEVSPDGRLVAYALSDGGTDWTRWRVRDVASGRDLPEVLCYTKFTSLSWARDSSGFYYSRYPAAASANAPAAASCGEGDGAKRVSIYHHRIGDAQSADRLVYAITDHPRRNPYGTVSEDGRFLVINVFDGFAVNGIYYIELGAEPRSVASPQVVRFLEDGTARYGFLGNAGTEMYFLTTDGAPRSRIVAIDVRRPGREHWREIVPENADALNNAHLIGGKFVLSYLHDAHARVKIADTAGRVEQELALPGTGMAAGFTGDADDPQAFFAYTDFLTPPAIYRYDVRQNRLSLFKRPQLKADTSAYLTEQVFYTSKDGTRVPMFIVRRRDLVKDGNTPMLLWGYGGFGSSLAPAFKLPVVAWLDAGGAYAVANLRGGSEYGEAWHQAGTKLDKQKVFDDFIAAAQWLVDQRYTSKHKLAVAGGSNGGLLVGAVITQRPDLFAAALPQVGVLDMLRYHTASANARQWSSEYGLSENPEEYRALRAYSPYHNVRAGTCYPPTLITTGEHDDRVAPWHSFKFAAALQAAQDCDNPVLIRVETRAGHGAGKPTWMQIESIAEQWTFLTQHLGVQLPASARSYTVIMSGTPKGELVVTAERAGERRAVLRYDDRGRGPDLVTKSRVDARGILQSFSVEGVSYAKRPVAEHFSLEAGRARWTSAADNGGAPAGPFYLPHESNAEDMAALARAILLAPRKELPLLPSGRATIRKVLEHEIEAEGRTAAPALYLISGVDLQPAPIWLDRELELFASGGNWLGIIRKGFEPALPELLAVEERALFAAASAQARGMQHRPSTPVVIRNATLFDAESRSMKPRVSVLVRGDRIEAVGAMESLAVPENAEVIDALGNVLLPGLWDMHVHLLDQSEGALDLLAGVTSVRDLGNDMAALQRLSEQFDDGSLAGPRVLKAGLIEGPGPFAGPTKHLVSTPAEVRDAVNLFADRGYPQVKLYSSLAPELVAPAVAAAHARGLRVSGHVPAGMRMREAVAAGFDEVQHANFWFLNFMPPEIVAATNTPLRFSAVYERARDLDLSSPAVRELIALLKAQGTVVDPTLVVFENMFTGWKGELAPWMKPWADRLPATMLRGGRVGGRASTPEQRAAFTESFERMKQMLKALYDAGVPIVAGTDASALQYSRELEIYAEAGIPATEVLYIATLGAARVMKQDAQTGSIAPGKRADLILVDGDPIRRIGDVRKTRLVMKGGVIYDAAALASAAGLMPARE